MIADNDAGAVSTYTEAGAKYGTQLLWLMALLLPCTYFIQEAVARLGIVTGQGYAPIIGKRFGAGWGSFTLYTLLFVNFLTLMTEFAMIKMASEKLGLNPLVAVPIAAAGLVFIVITAKYKQWERATLALCALNLVWLWLANTTSPGTREVVQGLVPNVPKQGMSSDLMFLVMAIVGTTIAPWQLFFQQSCVVDKRLRFSDLKWARLDTFVGGIAVIVIGACMILAGAALNARGIRYENPGQMAIELGKAFGPGTKTAVLLLMMNAAILGTTAVSLSSSWAYGEMKGWPHSLQKGFKDAPAFYLVYMGCIGLASGLVLLPGAPLQLIILSVQVLAGIFLPVLVVFLQLLLNDRQLMGAEFVNRPWNNIVNWVVIAILVTLSTLLVVQTAAPANPS
jgi:Mn2+/Fe2+ NRAMP family transporter